MSPCDFEAFTVPFQQEEEREKQRERVDKHLPEFVFHVTLCHRLVVTVFYNIHPHMCFTQLNKAESVVKINWRMQSNLQTVIRKTSSSQVASR